MQDNILSCYLVILTSQGIIPSAVISRAGEYSIRFPAILLSQVTLPSADVITVSAVTVVRIRYNKTFGMIKPLLPLYECSMTIYSPSTVKVTLEHDHG